MTAANLSAANGGAIPSAATLPVTNTTSDVNGVAFDTSGKGYLGSSGALESYDMPGWTGKTTVTTSLGGSTDLASCTSPPTITLEKVVVGGRSQSGDQFKLTLKQQNTELSSVTTTGTATGVQAERIGPLPTVRGIPLTFSEMPSGSTDLANYATSYRCLVDGVQTLQGNGTSGSITIPTSGQAVLCQIYNAPLTAAVTIHKDVKDASGTLNPGQGWTVTAQPQATTGMVTSTPVQSAQQTDAKGNASWTLRFGAADAKATISVSETQQTGYQFDSGSCVVTHLDGTVTTVALADEQATALAGIAAGDVAKCTYVNKPVTKLTITKIVNNEYARPAQANDFLLTATPAQGGTVAFQSGIAQSIEPGVYEIGETILAGYQQDGIVCMNGSTPVNITVMDGIGTVTVHDMQNIVCTITNSGKPGSVTWQKTDDSSTPNHLGGSQWILTGPGVAADTVVSDCTSVGSCGSGKYDDHDPRPGYFLLERQSWGSFTLTETKAPVGYVRSDTIHTYTISSGALDYAFSAAFVNKQHTPPVLPLTGGVSTDAFFAVGVGLLMVALGTALLFRYRNPSIGRSRY